MICNGKTHVAKHCAAARAPQKIEGFFNMHQQYIPLTISYFAALHTPLLPYNTLTLQLEALLHWLVSSKIPWDNENLD